MSVIDTSMSGAVGGAAGQSGLSQLSSDDFMKIVLSELSKQDPLAPNDSNALLEQLSSIRSMQSDMDLSNKLEAIVTQNELASASNMIGRFVSGVSEQNQRVADYVIAVSRTDRGSVLTLLNGARVPMANLDEVLIGDPNAPLDPPPPPPPATT